MVLSTVEDDRGTAFVAVDGDTGRTRWSLPRAGAAQTSEVVSTSPLWIRRVVAEGSELVQLHPANGVVVRGSPTARARRIRQDGEDVVRPLGFTPQQGASLAYGRWMTVGTAADGTLRGAVLDDDGTILRELRLGRRAARPHPGWRRRRRADHCRGRGGAVVLVCEGAQVRTIALPGAPLAAPLADEEGRWLVTTRGPAGDDAIVVVDGVAGTVLGASPHRRVAATADASRRGPQRSFAVAPGGSHAIALAVAEGGRPVLQGWSLLGRRAGFDAVAVD